MKAILTSTPSSLDTLRYVDVADPAPPGVVLGKAMAEVERTTVGTVALPVRLTTLFPVPLLETVSACVCWMIVVGVYVMLMVHEEATGPVFAGSGAKQLSVDEKPLLEALRPGKILPIVSGTGPRFDSVTV